MDQSPSLTRTLKEICVRATMVPESLQRRCKTFCCFFWYLRPLENRLQKNLQTKLVQMELRFWFQSLHSISSPSRDICEEVRDTCLCNRSSFTARTCSGGPGHTRTWINQLDPIHLSHPEVQLMKVTTYDRELSEALNQALWGSVFRTASTIIRRHCHPDHYCQESVHADVRSSGKASHFFYVGGWKTRSEN